MFSNLLQLAHPTPRELSFFRCDILSKEPASVSKIMVGSIMVSNFAEFATRFIHA